MSDYKPGCAVRDCEKPRRARGYCATHYQQFRRTGSASGSRRALSDGERLADFIDMSGDCWLWTGGIANNGYGKATVANRSVSAHRAVYEAVVEPIPSGLQIDHLCRVRHCVNPDHIEPVTASVNCSRRSAS